MQVSEYRRRRKLKLVALFGDKCHDCGLSFPPFMYDFDHRNPEDKSFALGFAGKTIAFEKLVEESKKCDMVCANCHRMRTHKQRCPGCEYCH